MALNFTPADTQSGYQSTESLNANFEALEELLEDALSRSGDSPNAMMSDLDMQGHRIYNLPNAVSNGEPVTYAQLIANLTPMEFAGYLYEMQTATDGQKVFTLSNAYTPGLNSLRVFVNGIYYPPSEYTEDSTNQITFTIGLEEDDEVSFVLTSFAEADYDTAATVQFLQSDGSYTSVQAAIDSFAFQTDLSYTVGTGGDFATITDALEYLSWYSPAYGAEPLKCDLTLLSGFVMAEQVVVYAKNFGWVTIYAQDAEVTISRAALTMGANDYDFAVNANLDSAHCAFLGHNGAVLPRIGCLFTMDTTGATNVDYTGVLVNNNSAVTILEGCGVKNVIKPAGGQSGRGLNTAHGSFAVGWGSVWSGCQIGIRVSNSSNASVRECVASGCEYGIDVNGASGVSCQDSTLSGCTYHSIWGGGKCVIKASRSDCSGTGTGGINSDYAAILCDGSYIDADSCIVSGSGRGIHVEGGGEVRFNAGVADAILGNGLTAIGADSSIVARSGATITDGLAGSAVVAQYGAEIDVTGSTITGWTGNGCYALGGKIIAYNATVTGNDSGEDLRVGDGGEIYTYGTCNTTAGGGTTVVLADTNVSRFNDRTSSGVIWTSGASILNGSKTHDFGSLADGAGETTTVTVTGAALGDFVEGVSLSVDLQGMSLTGYVSGTNTVSVRLQNETGSGPIDLGSATLRVRVRKA